MKAKDVMSTPVVTIRPDASVKAAIEKMVHSQISGMPVVASDGTLVGIVTEGDLIPKGARFRRAAGIRGLMERMFLTASPWDRRARARTVREVMTEHVDAVRPDEDLAVIAKRMLVTERNRMPVVEHETVVGMVSRVDILRVFDQTDASIEGGARELLDRCMYGGPEYEIELAVREGVVALRGTVLYESDRAVVENLVRGVPGVIGVDNYLVAERADPKSVPRRPEKEVWW